MGNFYVNYTLKGVTQQQVATAVMGRRAAITPAAENSVVMFDENSDAQDTAIISPLAELLSRKLSCPVLVVLNHDDDVLWFQLYVDGKLVDTYDSTPGYFDDSDEPKPPTGGNAKLLTDTFAGDPAEVETILRADPFDGYTFAFQRHADLVKALGLSDYSVGTAYASFEADELPDGLDRDDLMFTE